MRGRKPVHRLDKRPAEASGGAQRQTGGQVHPRQDAGVAGLLRRICHQAGGHAAGVCAQAAEPPGEGGADRRVDAGGQDVNQLYHGLFQGKGQKGARRLARPLKISSGTDFKHVALDMLF